jgi:hypothetical protein
MHQKTKASFTDQECYDIFVDTLIETFERQDWRNPKKKIFNDPNGPDKIINKIYECRRVNEYVASNRQKRKLNYNVVHIDQLEEENLDCVIPSYSEEEQNDLSKVVKSYFDEKNYFPAFIIDLIMNSTCYDDNEEDKDDNEIKRMSRIFRSVDNEYFRHFSLTYDISVDRVKKAYSYFIPLNSKEVQKKISSTLYALSRDTNLLKLLKG